MSNVNMDKTVTISRKDFLEKCAEVQAAMMKEHDDGAPAGMEMIELLVGMLMVKGLNRALFGGDEDEQQS